jgi:multiple sugar transport system permease protein
MPGTRFFLTKINQVFKIASFNGLVWLLLGLYLLPVLAMVSTALMPTEQLSDRNAPLYPARIRQVSYQGQEYQLYNVPTENGMEQWALIEPGQTSSRFINPQDPDSGPIVWNGNWVMLKAVYEFHPAWENFNVLAKSIAFPRMLYSSLVLTLVGELGILVSSILVAYGFARFRLPGGELLFYILIATILIPDKITFIPSFFVYVNFLEWKGTFLPILVPLFFGNAVYIFLLRQNFKSIPIDLEEAAMLDGAGPLRRLFLVVLPQSWPVVVTVSLLHFFYSWNETRLASLYLNSNSALLPLSFGIQRYQSRIPIQNIIQASTLTVLIIPVIVLFAAQRLFMQGVIVTGAENQ